MRKTTRRTISFLLAALMLLSLFPASAMAMPDLGTYEAETAPMPEETPGALLWPLAAGAVMLHNADTPEAAEAAETRAEAASIGIAPLSAAAVAGLGPLPSAGPGGTTAPGNILTHPREIIRFNASYRAGAVFYAPTPVSSRVVWVRNVGNRHASELRISVAWQGMPWSANQGALNVGVTRAITVNEISGERAKFTSPSVQQNPAHAPGAVSGMNMHGGGLWVCSNPGEEALRLPLSRTGRSTTVQRFHVPLTTSIGAVHPFFEEHGIVSAFDMIAWNTVDDLDFGTMAWSPSLSRVATSGWAVGGPTPLIPINGHWTWSPPAGGARGIFEAPHFTNTAVATQWGTREFHGSLTGVSVAPGTHHESWTRNAPGGRAMQTTRQVLSILDWFPNPTTPTIVSSNRATRSVTLSDGPAFATHTYAARPHAQRQWAIQSIGGVVQDPLVWQTSRTFTNLPQGEVRFVYRTAVPPGAGVGTIQLQYIVNANQVSAPSAPFEFSHTVSFDLNGATTPANIPNQTVASGQTATRPVPDPTRDGYIFRGWYTEVEYLLDSNEIVWRHLTTDGSGNSLIITEHVHGGGAWHSQRTTFVPLHNSPMRTTLNNWGVENLAPELRAVARVPNNVHNDVRNAPTLQPAGGPWINFASENGAAGRTSAGAATTENSALFILSISEMNQYFEGSYGHPDRIAYDVNGNPAIYWTRSPGGSSSHGGPILAPITVVGLNTGYFYMSGADHSRAIRPALWVSDMSGLTNLAPFDFNTPITEDTTLIAMWDEAVTVSFDLNGADTPASIPDQTFAPGGTATEPTPPPTRDGYTFRGWYHAPAENFTQNGIEWRVLHNAGDGHRLLITNRVFTLGSYNLTAVYTRLGVSNARTLLNNWWGLNVTGTLRAAAVPAMNVENDVRADGQWATQADRMIEGLSGPPGAGFTYPGSGTVAANGSNALFILSVSEANYYFDGPADRRAAAHGGAADSWLPWVMRSPGEMEGTLANISASNDHATTSAIAGWFRPTLWIYGDLLDGDGQSVFYTPFDFNTPITRDTHLIAMWDADHQVTFDLNGADTPASIPTQFVSDGDTATEPTPPPTRDGYTFRGWYTEGVEWRVLHDDGNGHNLIITERVHALGTQYNLTNVYTRLAQSNARTVLNNWWGTHVVGTSLEGAAVPVNNAENDVRNTLTVNDLMVTWENAPAGITTPGSGAVAANGSNALFILSVSEVNRFWPAIHSPQPDLVSSNGARTAYQHGEVTNLRRPWWLRSPGVHDFPTGTANSVMVVNSMPQGIIVPTNATGITAGLNVGLRPALWVDASAVPVGVGETFETFVNGGGSNLVPFDFTTPITRDTHLVAMWDEDDTGYEFQITFHMYDGSDDYEIVEVIPGTALNLTALADRGIPVAHILGTPEARGWALWGWFSDAQLDPATTGRALRNGFRRPVVGATGFPIGSVITQTMIDDLFDANGNLDLFVIWSLWGDANDDDRVDAADVLQMQRHLHDLLMDLIGQPRTWDVTINQIAANVTVSGTVGAADILRIERHLHDLLMDMIGQPRIWDIVLGRP